MKIGIVSWKKELELREKISLLNLPNIDVVNYRTQPEEFHDLDTVIFCDLEIALFNGNEDRELDNIRDVLSLASKLLLVNIQDEWVAEITKEIMKKSSVTVLDYNRNHFEEARNEEKAVYMIGLTSGLTIEEIDNKLNYD